MSRDSALLRQLLSFSPNRTVAQLIALCVPGVNFLLLFFFCSVNNLLKG